MEQDEYEYEATEDYHKENEDDTMMIDDHAYFCQVTTTNDTTRKNRPLKIGKYQKKEDNGETDWRYKKKTLM